MFLDTCLLIPITDHVEEYKGTSGRVKPVWEIWTVILFLKNLSNRSQIDIEGLGKSLIGRFSTVWMVEKEYIYFKYTFKILSTVQAHI